MSAASAMSKCAVGGCKEQPAPILCATHWPKVSGDVRRELVSAFKGLRGRGKGAVPKRLMELFEMAVREASK